MRGTTDGAVFSWLLDGRPEVLRVCIDVCQHLRSGADDLALVASDQRLLRAAQAGGLVMFNPETQDQASLGALVSP